MKKYILCGWIFALAFSAHAVSNEGRGGGDDVALEFQQALISAVEESKAHPQLQKVFVENDPVGTASKAIIVIVDDALDVRVRDLVQKSVAVNIPSEQRILINRQRWQEIQDSRIKSAIALHEALSLKGVEQTGYYPYSTKYLALVGGSVGSLNSSLQVNRIQQIQAANSKQNPAQVLKVFFDEAREPMTIEEFASNYSDENYKCGSIAEQESRLNVDRQFRPIYAYLTESFDGGPLFPNVRAWRLVPGWALAPKAEKASDWWGSKIRMVIKPTEVYQANPSYSQAGYGEIWGPGEVTLRKNNGLYTYKHLIYRYVEEHPKKGPSKLVRKEKVRYGYCYNSTPTVP